MNRRIVDLQSPNQQHQSTEGLTSANARHRRQIYQYSEWCWQLSLAHCRCEPLDTHYPPPSITDELLSGTVSLAASPSKTLIGHRSTGNYRSEAPPTPHTLHSYSTSQQ